MTEMRTKRAVSIENLIGQNPILQSIFGGQNQNMIAKTHKI